MNFLQILRIIFGSIYVLFIPGFLLTFVFFNYKKSPPSSELRRASEVDWLERITLSFALSIAVVPLVVFLLNLIGVKINTLNVFLEILLIIVLSLTWIFFQKSDYYKTLNKKFKLKFKK